MQINQSGIRHHITTLWKADDRSFQQQSNGFYCLKIDALKMKKKQNDKVL